MKQKFDLQSILERYILKRWTLNVRYKTTSTTDEPCEVQGLSTSNIGETCEVHHLSSSEQVSALEA